jgi:hypothetical protein
MCFQLCLSSRRPNASIYRAFHIPIRWPRLLCLLGMSIYSSNSVIFDTSLLQTYILCVCLGKFTVTTSVSFPKLPVCLILRLVILPTHHLSHRQTSRFFPQAAHAQLVNNHRISKHPPSPSPPPPTSTFVYPSRSPSHKPCDSTIPLAI